MLLIAPAGIEARRSPPASRGAQLMSILEPDKANGQIAARPALERAVLVAHDTHRRVFGLELRRLCKKETLKAPRQISQHVVLLFDWFDARFASLSVALFLCHASFVLFFSALSSRICRVKYFAWNRSRRSRAHFARCKAWARKQGSKRRLTVHFEKNRFAYTSTDSIRCRTQIKGFILFF